MRKQPNSRMCFLCGRENPIGLKLDFYEDPERGQVRGDFTVSEDYQGYPGVVHGGIVAAVPAVRAQRPLSHPTGILSSHACGIGKGFAAARAERPRGACGCPCGRPLYTGMVLQRRILGTRRSGLFLYLGIVLVHAVL